MATAKRKAIAYRRVSTERQAAEGWSLDAQRARMEEYAREHGLVLVEQIEESESASDTGRPGFARLLKALRSGKATIVVAEKLDRLSRNLRDLADLEDIVRAGVAVHLVRDRQIVDKDSPPSVWLTHDIGGAVARHFSRNLALEVRKGMRQRAASGKFANGAPPFGYRLSERGGDLVPHEREAPIVERMFADYGTGLYSYDEIAERLTSAGMLPRKAKAWSAGTIGPILANRTYTGAWIRAGGEWHPASHPAIVSASAWQAAREAEKARARGKGFASKRRRGVTRRPYSGLLQCAGCRGGLRYAPKYHDDGETVRYHYWCCRTPGCTVARHVREEELDEAMMVVLDAVAIPPGLAKSHVRLAASQAGDTAKRVTEVRRALKTNTVAQERVVEELLDGTFPRAMLVARQEKLTEQRDALVADLEALQAAEAKSAGMLDAIADAVKFCQDLPATFRHSAKSPDRRRALLVAILQGSGADRSVWDPQARSIDPAFVEPFKTLLCPSVPAARRIQESMPEIARWHRK